jgi:uracil-DNA glycosylase family 4
MSLQRTRLLLDEMGIGPSWALRAGPAVADEPAAPEPAAPEPVTSALAAAEPAPAAHVAVSAQAIAAMNWDQLAVAVASCTRCTLCQGRRNAVFGRGTRDASLVVVGSGPGSADEAAGMPLSGMSGQLLENMLAAINVAPQQVYVTNLVKCRVQAQTQIPTQAHGAEPDGAPTSQQLAACRPYLERELALLTHARTLLVLGQPAARSVLGPAVPALRGAVHRMDALAVVATLHPEQLLDQGQRMAQDRARAWADLCVARGAHDAPA